MEDREKITPKDAFYKINKEMRRFLIKNGPVIIFGYDYNEDRFYRSSNLNSPYAEAVFAAHSCLEILDYINDNLPESGPDTESLAEVLKSLAQINTAIMKMMGRHTEN